MTQGSVITGLGIWLPPQVRFNSAWPSTFGQDGKHADRTFNDIPPSEDAHAAAITERHLALEAKDPFLGCLSRRVADVDILAMHAEAIAGYRALQDAGVDPKDVDIILSNAAVPDRIAPPSATGICDRIGATKAFGVGMDVACASALVQMQMAHAYIQSGQAKHVLLTQSHLLLKTLPLGHPASPGLGDGASAMVMSKGGKGLQFRSAFGLTLGDHHESVCWVRHEHDNQWWQPGSAFRVGTRNIEGCKHLMRETVSFGAQTIASAAKRANIEVSSLDTIISVQPRGFIPHAIAERLGLSQAHAVSTYKYLGHLGGVGPVTNMIEARAMGRLGDRVAFYGQGTGFTRFATILTRS